MCTKLHLSVSHFHNPAYSRCIVRVNLIGRHVTDDVVLEILLFAGLNRLDTGRPDVLVESGNKSRTLPENTRGIQTRMLSLFLKLNTN